jgi:hypothetical protein
MGMSVEWKIFRTIVRNAIEYCLSYAGVGRTGTALHLYDMARGMSFDEASAQVRARRPQSTLLSPEQRAFLRHFGKAGKP